MEVNLSGGFRQHGNLQFPKADFQSPENDFKRVFENFIAIATIENHNKQCASKLLQSLLLQPNQVNDELQVINNKTVYSSRVPSSIDKLNSTLYG